jgi:hypothetical protein
MIPVESLSPRAICAHMALLIQSGINDEMPSFAKNYNEEETVAIVAYLKTLH